MMFNHFFPLIPTFPHFFPLILQKQLYVKKKYAPRTQIQKSEGEW